MKAYDIEVNESFGDVLSKMADEANMKSAEAIVDEAMQFIVKQCVTQARMGQYELKLAQGSDEYAKIYGNNGNAARYIEGTLSSKLKEIGLELKASTDGTFCEPYYLVCFNKNKEG